MRVHLVFQEGILQEVRRLCEVIGGIEVVITDESFDTACQYYEAKDINADVDVILAHEDTAVSSSVNGKLNRDQALLTRLMRLRETDARVLLLLRPERASPEHDDFISNLVSMGIYDFYFTDEIIPEDLAMYLQQKKTFADASTYLRVKPIKDSEKMKNPPENNVIISSKAQAKEKMDEKKKPEWLISMMERLPLFLRKTAYSGRVDTEGLAEGSKDDLNNFKSNNVEQRSREGNQPKECNTIYTLGADIQSKNAVNFKQWEKLLMAVEIAPPEAVVFDVGLEDLKEKIKQLRRNKKLLDVPVAVLGGDDAVFFRAGADECFLTWDENALDRLKEKRRRLSTVWSEAELKASRDHLTGLFNRSFLDGYLAEQVTNYKNSKQPFSVMLCDLDHFKRVNDTHGHQAGDEVLKRFALFLRENIRETDAAVRYGGEEFIVVFPGTDRETVLGIAVQLRKGWQEKRIYNTTFSAGVAEFGSDGITFQDVIKAADEALYRAKEGGRNTVLAAGREEKKGHNFRLEPVEQLKTRVLVVVGAAPRVGATSFALALAKTLEARQSVEILEAGGGAANWLNGSSQIPVRAAPPFSVSPGVITVVDAGTKIPLEVQPLAEAVFVVTDLSRNAVHLKNYSGAGSIYLVGNRGASFNGLKELASLWDMEALFSLPEEGVIREAEIERKIMVPKSWNKYLKKLL